MHTTNYRNTFIRVAPDCPVTDAQVPPLKASGPTAANVQFELLQTHPYRYSSDDVLFEVFARRHGLTTAADRETAHEAFFSKGQACMRASALPKKYGWGIHNDSEGRIALVPAGTPEYDAFARRTDLKQVDAMRSKRA